MTMLNNVVEADVFAISRIPIPSPQCTKMEEVDPLYVAPSPERLIQVRPHRHHAEDGAVAERVDGVDALEKKDKKTVSQDQVWQRWKRHGPQTQTSATSE